MALGCHTKTTNIPGISANLPGGCPLAYNQLSYKGPTWAARSLTPPPAAHLSELPPFHFGAPISAGTVMASYTFRSLLTLAAAGLFAVADAPQADAQYFGYSGPGVSVSVSPYGTRVHTPGVGVAVPGRAYYGTRRSFRRAYYGPGIGYSVRTHVAPAYPAPGYVVSGAPVASGSVVVQGGAVVSSGSVNASTSNSNSTPTPAYSAVASDFASEAELAAMNTEQLVIALANATGALDGRLSGMTGGEGWQKYLVKPAAKLADTAAAAKLLRRFDSVARDAQFVMIANLPEFQAVRLTLRMMAEGGVAASPAPAQNEPSLPDAPAGVSVQVGDAVSVKVEGETLPTPGTKVDVSTGGVTVERSVLTDGK